MFLWRSMTPQAFADALAHLLRLWPEPEAARKPPETEKARPLPKE